MISKRFTTRVFAVLGFALIAGCGAPPSLAVVTVTSSVDFGTVSFGQTSDATILLSNTGTASASSIEVSGLATPFSYKGGSFPGTGGTCSTTITTGSSCTIILTFTSSAPTLSSTATITISYSGGTKTFTLTGASGNGAYSPAKGTDNTIYAILSTTQGTYFGGNPTSYRTGSVGRVFRVDSTGTLDTTFSTASTFNNQVAALMAAPDGSGKVYVGGLFTNAANPRITRLSTDGSIDTTFAIGTGLSVGQVNALATVPDNSGDIYAVGTFSGACYPGGGTWNRIIRIKSDGSANTAFGGTGAGGNINGIAVAPDASGDIYVVGAFTTLNGQTFHRIGRFNSDGTHDAGFDTLSTGLNNTTYSVIAAPDATGDIFVGGSFTYYQGTAADGTLNRVARFTSTGALAGGWSSGTGFDSTVFAMAAATDGSTDVYAGGQFTTYNGTAASRIIRINSDGSTDTAFNTGTGFNVGSIVQSVYALSDGSGDVLVGGSFTSYNGTGVNRMVRLNADGTIDTTLPAGTGFNAAVYAQSSVPSSSSQIYLGGNFTTFSGGAQVRIARLGSDGALDTSFVVGAGFTGGYPQAIAAPTDGTSSIWVGGTFTTYQGAGAAYLTRLTSSGTVDGSYTNPGFDAAVWAVAAATDSSGDVYVGGDFTTPSAGIVRLNSNGSTDAGFAVAAGFGGGGVRAIAAATDGSGDVYVGGAFTTYKGVACLRLVRLNSDGTVDAGFNTGASISAGTVMAIHVATDGSGDIYVGGTFTDYQGAAGTANRIVRIQSTGSVQTSFAMGTAFNGDVNSIATVGDGSYDIVAVGNFTTYQGGASAYVARLNADGTPDSTFSATTGGFSTTAYSVIAAPDSSGDVYVGGAFTTYRSTMADYTSRLSSTGTAD